MTLTFEDFPVGHFGTFGPRHVTRDDIIAFASEFDPQPMHLDEEAAKRTMGIVTFVMRVSNASGQVLLEATAPIIVERPAAPAVRS